MVADGVGTGSHHLYASAFSGHCGLAAWETNSYVVHAVSTTGPGGPFAVADTAVYSDFDIILDPPFALRRQPLPTSTSLVLERVL